VHGGGVLDGDERVELEAADAELADGRRPVRQQPLAELRVDPRARDDARAVLGAKVALVVLDHRVDRVRREQALLDQQGLERGGANCGIGRHAGSR
jgi:hypothetical protein